MRIDAVEVRRTAVPLVEPFRTAHGDEHVRHAVLVRVVGDGAEGWGECAAMTRPLYTSEYADGAAHVLEHHLAPRLAGRTLAADAVAPALDAVRGHPMAKAALELAVLDADLRAAGRSLGDGLGAARELVPSGIVLGITEDVPDLLAAVALAVAEGYRRVKLKIRPGWDVEPVAAVRAAFPDALLQVDANGSYTAADVEHLGRLDAFDLLAVEQPLPAHDLDGHVAVGRRLRTPVALDESITSARVAAEAIRAGACSTVVVKAGHLGGYLEAVRVHDVCAAAGVPAFVGGMLETGLGRAANVALAALPGFTLPGDLSPSSRWFAEDVTEPLVLEDGHLRVPTGPGLGRRPRPEVLARVTVDVAVVRP